MYKVTDGIGELIINRPQARNALNWQAQENFAAAVEAAANDSNLRALIITATGDQAFASGGDLKELSEHTDQDSGRRLNRVMGQALTLLTELPLPVIAAVNGDAVGGGCEIMTACDLRMAASRSRFHFAQVKVGLTTGWGGTARLVRLVGQSKAMELLLTGRTFDAQEAVNFGLVHRLVPQGGQVLESARAWADLLACLPREALAATKKLVHAAGRLPIAETNALETDTFTQLWASRDHLEALSAFVNKRDAQFNQE